MSKRASANQRYAAFLRGVSPMNAKMPELKKCFEAAGFTDVETVLSSGNVVFSAPAAPIEKTFGKDVTTRTWDTVKKVAASHPDPPLSRYG